jgi:hypothetical protein
MVGAVSRSRESRAERAPDPRAPIRACYSSVTVSWRRPGVRAKDIATLAADAGHTPNAEPPTPQRSARERTPGMLIEFVLVIVLALCNGFFALSEMALMTARRSRIKQHARERLLPEE